MNKTYIFTYNLPVDNCLINSPDVTIDVKAVLDDSWQICLTVSIEDLDIVKNAWLFSESIYQIALDEFNKRSQRVIEADKILASVFGDNTEYYY